MSGRQTSPTTTATHFFVAIPLLSNFSKKPHLIKQMTILGFSNEFPRNRFEGSGNPQYFLDLSNAQSPGETQNLISKALLTMFPTCFSRLSSDHKTLARPAGFGEGLFKSDFDTGISTP